MQELDERLNENYINLLAAIIRTALSDYKTALKENDEIETAKLEKFFNSKHLKFLSLGNEVEILKYVSVIKNRYGYIRREKIYTVREVAEILGVSEYTVIKRYIRKECKNPIKAYKVGGSWQIREKDLNKFLSNRKR